MWQVVSVGHNILLGAHIHDVAIACANRPVIDAFRTRLLVAAFDVFRGYIRWPSTTLPGCDIDGDMVAGTTSLSQKHGAKEILRLYGFWDIPPPATHLWNPTLAVQKIIATPTPNHTFWRYCGTVGSFGFLVTMTVTRSDLTWSYSELSKYLQFLGIAHMEAFVSGSPRYRSDIRRVCEEFVGWAHGKQRNADFEDCLSETM